MDGDIVEQVTSWNSKPFDGGFGALQTLADDEFNGAVATEQTWLFFLNGNVVGVFDGAIDAFADSEGTIYQAPGMALPLLFAMRERGGEQKAQYYTEDTPLPEVDATLSDSNFTGYIELSENVLSGDYYVAYYGGRSLAAAFVGNQSEIVTGEDAFERAADEVGIYEVRTVPIDVVDIPEPDDDTAVGGVVTEAESDPDQPDTATDLDDTSPTPTEPDEDTTDPTTQPPSGDSAETPDTTTDDEPPDQPTEPNPSPTAATNDRDTGEESPPTRPDATEEEHEERFDDEAEWRETRTIPSLSPSETDPQNDEEPTPASTSNGGTTTPTTGSEDRTEELGKREAELEELEDRIETLAAERNRAKTERDDLEEELRSVREERNQLATRVDDLETQLDDDSQPVTGGDPGTTGMAAEQALAETNLFIRYGSRGDATLDAVADGISPEEVHNNLQLDVHTQFDAADVTVDGDPFEVFLEESPEYAFVEWVIRELPFEIRETDHGSKLIDLYGALPQIDRAQFRGAVSGQTEDGEVRAEYDVILRSKKGDPLIVASINDSRDPVTGDMMRTFVESTTEVAREFPEIGAAMSVTASFFKPDALEAAETATGGGFLSRDSRVSFVRTSRKQGYHLCLVESRKGSFHVNIPEL